MWRMWKRNIWSHPTRDVWVEIGAVGLGAEETSVTSHTGCVSRNACSLVIAAPNVRSHPTRDVWVEISTGDTYFYRIPVTSHTGCVSRNYSSGGIRCRFFVTSHTGCVSRNCFTFFHCWSNLVTSHTGCVSRNENGVAVDVVRFCHIPHGMCE